jgi:hypothetical protein
MFNFSGSSKGLIGMRRRRRRMYKHRQDTTGGRKTRRKSNGPKNVVHSEQKRR